MRRPHAAPAGSAGGGTCSACEGGEATILARSAHPAAPSAALDVDAALEATRRGGEPLPQETRTDFERHLGHDFGHVRVHTDPGAARAVGARAYTVGSLIVFGAGEYAPGTSEGKRLLAHELTHVVQQGAGEARAVQRQPAPSADPGLLLPGFPPPELEQQRADARAEMAAYKAASSTFEGQLARLVAASTPKDVAEARKDAETAVTALEESAERYLEAAGRLLATLDQWMDPMALVMLLSVIAPSATVMELAYSLLQPLVRERRAVAAERFRVEAAGRNARSLLEQNAQIRATEAALRAEKDPERRRRLADQLGSQRDRFQRTRNVVSGGRLGRFPPGTWGKDSQGRCYVVYENEVRVGGDLGWRLQNRQSQGRGPSASDPPGTLAHIPPGECGGKVGLYVYSGAAASKADLMEKLRKAKGRDLTSFLIAHLQGNLTDEQSKKMGNDRDIYVRDILRDAGACAGGPVQVIPPGRDDDPEAERLRGCIADAIIKAESGSAKAGDTYTCDNAPDEYFAMLGCDAAAP